MIFFPVLIILVVGAGLILKGEKVLQVKEDWIGEETENWPMISMVNDIRVFDKNERF